MALIFVPQYTLDFDTNAGSDITWELDILRSYDDADPTPSWVTDGVTSLVGTGKPISIEWQKDYNVYKPINGSSAKINLLVQNEGQYADFNNAGPFEYQVRLRYRDDMSVNQEYWCGYITPLETNESITTFPFEVNYTATDGLALLQDRIVAHKVSEDDIAPIDTVLRAIYETGLDLPVYIDSKIYEGSNDALISATANANSFYKNTELTERITIKEAIEGYLLAFNCKIYQSNARWYITNASTHGGSGTEESATFRRYEVVSGATEYTATTDSDAENLVYNLNGTSTRDLIPANDDLNLTIRRPVGSVECNPTDLVPLNIVDNGTFEIIDGTGQPEDWVAHGDSIDQTLTTSTAIRLDGQRSITTGRSRKSLDKSSEIWFQNTVGIDVDQSVDFKLSIDILGELLKTSGNDGGRNVLFSYQLFYDTPTDFTINRLDIVNTLLTPTFIPLFKQETVNRLYFDFENNEWFVPRFGFSAVQKLNETYNTVELAGQDLDTWIAHTANIKSVNEYWDEKDERYYPVERGELFLRVFYLQTNKQQGRGEDSFQGNETGTVRVYLDNIRITNEFEEAIAEPTFERLQLDYNETLDYEPRFASGVNELITQKLNPTDTYFRSGKIETTTLERIVTQQKLNDYRGGNTIDPEQSSLRYYEGSVINNTLKPFAPKDKLLIDYSNYTEATSCIFNGGMFDVKSNKFKFYGYIPNQLTDIAPGDGDTALDPLPAGFYEQNVDLVAEKFPGRSNMVTYTLAFAIDTTDSTDSSTVDEGLLPLTENNSSFIQITGLPGSVIPMELRLVPAVGYIGNPAGCSVRVDAVDEPRPRETTFGDFKNSQGDIVLPLSITLPDNAEYEIFYIDGSITPFTPENTPAVVPATVVVTLNAALQSQGSLKNPASTTFNVGGVPGSVVHFTYFAESTAAYEIFATNFSITESDTSLENLDARQVGTTGVAIDFEYTVPTTTESVPVTLNGTGSTPSSITNPAYTYDVTFATVGTDFDLFEATNQFKGVEGTVVPYDILVIPNEGYDLSATNFSHATLPAGITRRANTTNGFAQNGQEVILPINVAIGSSSTSGTITITGDSQEEPYSLTFVVNDVGSEGWTVDNSQKIQPYGITDFGDSIPTFTFYVTPNDNMVFTDVDVDSQVMADINEAAIGLPEAQFSIARSYVSDTTDPNFGKIQCIVSGLFPNLTTLTTFPKQATVSINITGEAGVGRSTIASFAVDEITIPLGGGFPKVAFQSNGTVQVVASSSSTSITPISWLLNGNVTYTNNGNGNGSVGHNGAVLGTSAARVGYWLMFPSDDSTGTPLDFIKVSQEDPSASGIETTGYSLTGVAISGGQYLGIATYTDGQGTERIVATSTVQTITFCSATVPNALAGAIAPSSVPTCVRGTVSGGQSYADEAGDSSAIAGSNVVYTSTAPTSASDDGIYFIAQ